MPKTLYFWSDPYGGDDAYDTLENWWTNVEHTTPASVVEKFTVDFTGLTAAGLADKYFTCADRNGAVYIWFRLDGAGTDPAPGGRGIMVDILTGDGPSTIAANLQTALTNDEQFQYSTVLTNVVTVINTYLGARANAADGNTGASISTTQQGTSVLPGTGDTIEIDSDMTSGPSVAVTLAKANVNYGESDGLVGCTIDLTAISEDSELKSGGAISGGGVVARQTGGENNGLVLGDITGGINGLGGTVNGDMKGSAVSNYGIIVGDQSVGLSYGDSTIGSLSGGECDGHCLGDMTGGLLDFGGDVDGNMSDGECRAGCSVGSMSGGTNYGEVIGDMSGGVSIGATLHTVSGGTVTGGTVNGNVTGGTFDDDFSFVTSPSNVTNATMSGIEITADGVEVTFEVSANIEGSTFTAINGGSFVGTPGPGIATITTLLMGHGTRLEIGLMQMVVVRVRFQKTEQNWKF